jgi:hypothetical protein
MAEEASRSKGHAESKRRRPLSSRSWRIGSKSRQSKNYAQPDNPLPGRSVQTTLTHTHYLPQRSIELQSGNAPDLFESSSRSVASAIERRCAPYAEVGDY